MNGTRWEVTACTNVCEDGNGALELGHETHNNIHTSTQQHTHKYTTTYTQYKPINKGMFKAP